MNRKTYLAGLALSICMLVCTGCSNKIPEMTEEEQAQISQYTASLLIKYNKNSTSRLVDLEAADEREKRIQENMAAMRGDTEEETSGRMNTTDDTPVVSVGEDTQGQTDKPIDTADTTIEGFLSLPEGISISYEGHRVVQQYPDDSNSDVRLDAPAGKILLVIDFKINNQSQVTQNVDLLSETLTFYISINGNSKRDIMLTLFENDLSLFKGDIPAGSSVDVVLLAEIPELDGSDITSLTLSMKKNSDTASLKLQ